MTDDKGLIDAYSSIYKKEENQLDEVVVTGSLLAAKAAMGAMKGAKVAGALGKAAKVAGKVQSVADAAGSVGDAANKIRGKGQHHPSNQQEEVEVVAEKKKDWGTGSKQRFKTKERKAQEREDIAIERMLGLPKRKKPEKNYPFNNRYEEVEPVMEVHPAVVTGAKLAGKAALAGVASEVGSQVVKKIKGEKKKVKEETIVEKKKMLKVKVTRPIKTKVTEIGPGGKEYVKKDWSEDVEGGVSVVDYDSEYTPTEIETVDIIDAPKMQGTEDLHETEEALEERLWDQVAANLTTLGEMRGIKYQVSPFEEEVEQIDELKDTTLKSYIDKAQVASRSLSDKKEVAKKKQGIDRAKDTITGTKKKRPKSRYDLKNYENNQKNYLMGIETRKSHKDYGKIPTSSGSSERPKLEEFDVRSPLTFSKKEEPKVDVSELEEKYACSTKKAHKRLKK